MKATYVIIFLFAVTLILFQSCRKPTTTVVDFSKITTTDNECRVISIADSGQWINSVLEEPENATLLNFADNINITDTTIGPVQISSICPNPCNGFFIWNVNPSQQTKLRLICVNTNYDVLYYNAYRLEPGPFTIGFDLRPLTAFRKNTNYRMYFGFYTGLDSLYFTGHGDFRLQ